MSKIHNRYIKKPVTSDLKSKMVFIGGPRQVGKTTLALKIAEQYDFPVIHLDKYFWKHKIRTFRLLIIKDRTEFVKSFTH